MKKVISVFLAVCMLFGAMQTLGFTVFAETSDFYEYEIIYDEETDSYYAEITGVDESISGDVTIPSTLGSYPVKSIGEWSFGSCRDIESIVFPNSVMKIGYNAFWNCAGLKSVTIPSSIVEISGSPFPNCWQLPEINVDESNGYFTSVDGVLFDKSKIRLIQYPAGKLDANYIIPDGTEIIGTNAFEGSYYLKNVTVCNSVNSIEDGAFTRCYELIGVKFPDNMENWGSHVFYDCQALRNVKIPKGIKSIYQYTFYRCYSLTSVIIPSSVTSIEEDSAFLYCNMLTDIYYDGNEEQWNNIINCLGEELSCFDDTTIHYNSEGPDLSNPQEFLKYEVSENKAVITECINREVEEIIIPQTLGGYTVVGIHALACNNILPPMF